MKRAPLLALLRLMVLFNILQIQETLASILGDFMAAVCAVANMLYFFHFLANS